MVFTSGYAAVLPRAGAAAVGAINAAIEALAKAFAERGIEDGVQVNCVSPGAVITGRRLGMLEGGGREGHRVRRRQGGLPQTGRHQAVRHAGEIADLTAFAVSPSARWMTGTVLRMDGGEIRSM